MIDWNKAPEWAIAHTTNGAWMGEHGYNFLEGGDLECHRFVENGYTFDSFTILERRPPTTPTLETMLAEWRDLTARAQAAQAEADALFEHAGQCHGEIVVRLADLGWGAPRVAAVVSEPVLAEYWYMHVKAGDMLTYRKGDGECHMGGEWTDGQSYKVHSVDPAKDTIYAFEVWCDGGEEYYWGNRNYFTPSAQQ